MSRNAYNYVFLLSSSKSILLAAIVLLKIIHLHFHLGMKRGQRPSSMCSWENWPAIAYCAPSTKSGFLIGLSF